MILPNWHSTILNYDNLITSEYALAGGRPNDGFWHNPDLQHPLELGPIMAALPTFGAECLVIAAFQTWRRGVAKVGT